MVGRSRRWLPIAWLGLFLAGAGPLVGCDGGAAGIEIGGAVQLLSTSRGELSEQAIKRLVLHGRQSLPYLEAALHTAAPTGRRNLAIALRRIGLPETAPLLGHIAAFDSDRATAREAWQTLNRWSSERSRRAGVASQALRKVDEVRGMSALLLDAE